MSVIVEIEKIKPYGSQILIKRSPGGIRSELIILPDSNPYDKLVAEVVSVGPGEVLIDGTR